jgi:HK97 family phage major capsid protein
MLVKHNELLAEATKKFNDAQALLVKDDASAEDLQTAERLTNEVMSLKARASQLQKLELERPASIAQDEKSDSAAPSEFKSWRDFVGALRRVVKSKGRDVDPRFETYKELGASTGAGGGVLVPVQQMENLMAVAATQSIVRSRASVIDMDSRSVEMPVLDQTAASTDTPSYFGGIKVNWTEDGQTIADSDPKYRDLPLVAYELTGSTIVRNTLLDDVPALSSYLGGRLGFPGAIAHAEDFAFLRGNGVGKPLGIINSAATVSVTRTTSSEIKYDDLANMMGRFMGETPVWVASIAAKSKLLLMNGPSGNPSYLWGNTTTGIPGTLMGYPIIFTDKLPAVGSKGDILLADMSYYLVGNRENATTVESSDQPLFASNKTVFRIVHRVGGSPWLSAPITLVDGSTTVSPFVVIAA